MGYIKEPIGVDLIVSPMPLSDDDRQKISAVIAHFKKTGEILVDLSSKNKTNKRKVSKKPRNRVKVTA
jgi:hypothetical protein